LFGSWLNIFLKLAKIPPIVVDSIGSTIPVLSSPSAVPSSFLSLGRTTEIDKDSIIAPGEITEIEISYSPVGVTVQSKFVTRPIAAS